MDSWDHVVFAFHLPNGSTLTIPRKNLIGGDPLRTEHRTCLKFRRNFGKSGEVCAEEEARCQSRVQGTDLSGIGIDDLFCSFEDIDSSADSGLQSSPEIKCHKHLTEGVAEPDQSTSQDDVVDMGNVSVEELFGNFEDADSLAEEETESHSHLTKERKKRACDAVQEDVVDMGNVSVEELFSSFEDADSSAQEEETESHSHLTKERKKRACDAVQEDVVDMGNVSVEELLSSFEDADSLAEEETESHSHLTKERKKCACDAVQEDVVDMGNVSVEELFSSFEDADSSAEEEETKSRSHLTKERKKRACDAVQEDVVHLTYTNFCVKEHVPFSSLEECPVVGSHHLQEGSYAPNQQSPVDHSGLHALPTANTVQWVEPIGHSSPRLTRKRRHRVHYSVGDLDCALDSVDSPSSSINLLDSIYQQC